MSDDYSPPDRIRLVTEIDRLAGADDEASAPSSSKPVPASGAASLMNDILHRKASVRTAMEVMRDIHADADNIRQRAAATAARRLRDWGSLRAELATGKRRGWWWFKGGDGSQEPIPPDWWNSDDAEIAATRGSVSLTRRIGSHVHSIEAIVIIEELRVTDVTAVSMIKDKTEATKFLVDLMSRYPRKPPEMNNKTLLAMVRERFPGLSERAFNSAKEIAVAQTGAIDWIAKGRRKVDGDDLGVVRET